ncbi:DMT family transporter [Tolumonas osonensis]|uniref:Drug/metabolite transporter (DMT)-like permease n=1 Tax=Tolumonas osonensis TaxID=675874 RepID=A0A841G9J5_9GAMM|nr:DMT family transporter [Tolumonas osonensis]MBB6055708.1 drug/metabolite transporter (DMT)-like permease [Tolumonas osonensis]
MSLEWLALVSAFLWACASLLSVVPARHLGTFAFSRWRMACVSLMLGVMGLVSGGFYSLSLTQVGMMASSGLIGIFIGDTCLYACMNRIGPRRSSLLFATHAAFSALFGIWLFQEQLSLQGWSGAALVFAGVLIAVAFSGSQTQKLEYSHGALWLSLCLGLMAALCQSLGTIIAKPVMMAGADPIAASCIRMLVAFAAHAALRLTQVPFSKAISPINLRILGIITLNGLLAMVLGMTIFLFALKHGNVTLVAIMSSTSPVMLLPILWIFTRQRPGAGSWLGAVLVVTGTALVLAR